MDQAKTIEVHQQAHDLHARMSKKIEESVDAAIRAGVIPASQRNRRISHLHMKRVDAILAILERGK